MIGSDMLLKLTRPLLWAALLGGVLFTACESFLEDVSPDAALPLDSGLETQDALETFLMGTYSLLQSDGDILLVVLPDLGTQNAEPIEGACPAPLEFERNDLSPGNFFVDIIWESAYEIINQANLVIEGAERLLAKEEISPSDADQLSGEAYFLRAVVYFEMVRMFSLPLHLQSELGIPLLTQGVDNTDKITYPPRASVAAIYAQINSDLLEASQRLPQDAGQAGRASYFATLAYQAEVAFQNEEYATASNLTRQIIDAGVYDLVDPPETYFLQKGTSEEIWSLINTEQDGGALFSLTLTPNCNSTRLDMDLFDQAFAKIITESQQVELDENGGRADDLRYSNLSFIDETAAWRTLKYPDPNGANNLPAMRYAEILLMYAECQARLGNAEEAITCLNKIRGRAIEVRDAAGNLLPDDLILFSMKDFADINELIEAIILERQVELVMEGNRFHDLIRLRRDVNGKAYDDGFLRWPIPQRELDANTNLVQNPGY